MYQELIKRIMKEVKPDIKTETDAVNFKKMIMKEVIETALSAELDDHLGYEKHDNKIDSNSRNGYSEKTLTTDDGVLEIKTPRDRNASFDPKIIKKNQTRFTGMDNQIIAMYARGMSTRDISQTLKEIYGADVSPTFISKVTDTVMDKVIEWQSRPLDPIYPIVYLDCIFVKIKHNHRVVNKAVYLALAVNLQGKKELLGMWISENEGASFWNGILSELKNRGVQDILIACVDGLKGFPDAINANFPNTQIQLCIVHLIRNSLKYVSYKHKKELIGDLKLVYKATTEEQALYYLDKFEEKWNSIYASVSRIWRDNWQNLNTFFAYNPEIRRAIYTTNAIESLNSVIRKVIKTRKSFSNDDSAKKIIYLAIRNASERWTMPIKNWKLALNSFIMEFGERITKFSNYI